MGQPDLHHGLDKAQARVEGARFAAVPILRPVKLLVVSRPRRGVDAWVDEECGLVVAPNAK